MNIRIFLISLFLFNFMYLSPDRKHWIDLVYERFPVVKYKVNPLMIGFNTGSKESIIDAIRSSSDFWSFRSGDAHFQFSYNGTTTNSPLAFNGIACDEDGKQRIRETDNLVFASNTDDPDCSGQACTYIWSCTDKNEILHFDMQINSREYEWDTGTNHKKSFNLTTVAAKQFGQILGLDHCPLGLNTESCSSEVASRGTSDPSFDSLLYRFIDAEVIRNSLSSDDRAGLQSLYGSISPEEATMKSEMNEFYSLADRICNPSPCVIPEEDIGKYQLSTEEIQARAYHISELAKDGLDYRTAIFEMTQMLKKLHQDSYIETGNSAETYLLSVTKEMIQDISGLSPEMLLKSRQILSIQIKNRKFILSQFKNEFDTDFLKFTQAELNLLIQYRREIINRMGQ
ncbi:MAG TPA: hypothetical protein PK079_10830 [Leptospiraceae bacterium]|nr:hypothetical protein [Leptospiraceae bacterium]HMW05872.1 hypothetical protein [Leptospiraceae bacterium]HMX34764.1 hypothetical protein [Leptospiraceae bacterium]HMY32763.1 hypothetical protein [Leptospiraceae bacterium]HMZ67206.1 hypothetical protein [Leptospiraceae bacterium]